MKHQTQWYNSNNNNKSSSIGIVSRRNYVTTKRSISCIVHCIIAFLLLFLLGMISTIIYMHYNVLFIHDINHNNSNNKLPGISSSLLSFPSLCSNTTTTTTLTTTRRTDSDNNNNDLCYQEYLYMLNDTSSNGLTVDDYERSIAHVGNRYRIQNYVIPKLLQSSSSSYDNENKNNNDNKDTTSRSSTTGLTVVVCGGSISLGHGVTPTSLRYSDQLELYLNNYYYYNNNKKTNTQDVNNNQKQQQQPYHKVYNRGSHGADMCAMAKRMNFLDLPTQPDLIILEFAVNDYQGQDHKIHIDHRTDVFFDGFQSLASCAEIVVYKLLHDYPKTAIVFLEFQTAILNRKTAQLLHLGVAQHYNIPVISYADTMWPDFYRLIDTLQPYHYSLPSSKEIQNQINVQYPYPHGCAPCHAENILEQFRDKGCKSICVYMERSGLYKLPTDGSKKCDSDPDVEPCYVPFLAHDAVHPSAIGHQFARDLILHFLTTVQLDTCRGRTYRPDHIPTHGGWLIAASHSDTTFGTELLARSNYVLVQDTMEVFAKQNPLLSNNHSTGFVLKPDALGRKGWIATNPLGGEYITFDINLPTEKCYVIYVSILKSYETVGSVSVTVQDLNTNTQTDTMKVDCIWQPHISIPSDIQITSDDHVQCSGKCRVTITTHKEIAGRNGNLVKIMSLSVRECIILLPSQKK